MVVFFIICVWQLLYLRIGYGSWPVGVVRKNVIVQALKFISAINEWNEMEPVSPVYHPFHPRMTGGLDVGEWISGWRVDRVDWMDAGDGCGWRLTRSKPDPLPGLFASSTDWLLKTLLFWVSNCLRFSKLPAKCFSTKSIGRNKHN